MAQISAVLAVRARIIPREATAKRFDTINPWQSLRQGENALLDQTFRQNRSTVNSSRTDAAWQSIEVPRLSHIRNEYGRRGNPHLPAVFSAIFCLLLRD